MKTLAELAALVEGAEIKGDAAAKIADIVHDSREVTEGTLFVAIEGLHVDGHSFIAQAVEKGACAILTEREIEIPEGAAAVLRVPNLAAALEVIVPFFHDYPSRKMRIIGITGTNGKTTTSYMTRAILREAGYKVGLIGTIQILVEEEALPIQYDSRRRRPGTNARLYGAARHGFRRHGGFFACARSEPRGGHRIRYGGIHEPHAGSSRLP